MVSEVMTSNLGCTVLWLWLQSSVTVNPADSFIFLYFCVQCVKLPFADASKSLRNLSDLSLPAGTAGHQGVVRI
jgi:hypothetical protein